jgi:hypothetical protein
VPVLLLCQHLPLEIEENNKTTSVRIFSNLSAVWIGYFPNTSLECKHYKQLSESVYLSGKKLFKINMRASELFLMTTK